MRELLDDLFTGTVSRRKFLERATAAGLALPLVGSGLSATAQKKDKPAQPKAEAVGNQEENPVYSPANIGGGGRIERNFYRDWIKRTNIPKLDDPYSVYDIYTQEVKPWPEIDGRGLYINFTGNVHMDGVIYEIPEGKALAPARRFYEQVFIVLKGRGHTMFGPGKQQGKVEWGEGSMFAGPVNVTHRHYNADPAKPARLLAITSFPIMLQIFGSMNLINNLAFDFKDRYDGGRDYFSRSGMGEGVRKRWNTTNFVKDIRTAEVIPWPERGEGNASVFWDMSGNTILEPHMSEFGVGSYKRGHRHPYEAIILTLNGKGFSLTGKDSLKESDAEKIDWKAGSLVSPPYYWYHQHFNTGASKARYFAMTEGDFPKRLGIPLQVEQIEGDREDPDIKKRFERELKKSSAAQSNGAAHQHGEHAHDHSHDHSHGGGEHAHHHDGDPNHHGDRGGVMSVQNDWRRGRRG